MARRKTVSGFIKQIRPKLRNDVAVRTLLIVFMVASITFFTKSCIHSLFQ